MRTYMQGIFAVKLVMRERKWMDMFSAPHERDVTIKIYHGVYMYTYVECMLASFFLF